MFDEKLFLEVCKQYNVEVVEGKGNNTILINGEEKELTPELLKEILIGKRSTTCWFCGCAMIWGGDNDFSDFGYDGEGVVANLSCPNCGATAEFTTEMDYGE